jgi:hypothetical protein
MSKKKALPKQKTAAPSPVSNASPDAGRRNFMLLGASALAVAGVAAAGAYNAGWFDSAPAATTTPVAPRAGSKNLTPVALPADYQNALRAAI